MLMLHGYSDSWFSFSRVLPLLPDGMRVMVPDQRGHGDSDRPHTGYAVDDLATDAIQLLDALGVQQAVVVGHSMGSLVARRVAERVPARVQRLVLVGGSLTIRNAVVEELRKEITALEDPVNPEFVRAFQLSTIHQPVPDAFVERVVQDSRKLTAHVWKALLAGMWNDEPAPHTIRTETIVLAGAKDAVFSVAEQQALAAAIPGAKFKLLEDIGHAVHWEDPQALVAVLENAPSSR